MPPQPPPSPPVFTLTAAVTVVGLNAATFNNVTVTAAVQGALAAALALPAWAVKVAYVADAPAANTNVAGRRLRVTNSAAVLTVNFVLVGPSQLQAATSALSSNLNSTLVKINAALSAAGLPAASSLAVALDAPPPPSVQPSGGYQYSTPPSYWVASNAPGANPSLQTSSRSSGRLSGGAIAGIVCGVLSALALMRRFCGRMEPKPSVSSRPQPLPAPQNRRQTLSSRPQRQPAPQVRHQPPSSRPPQVTRMPPQLVSHFSWQPPYNTWATDGRYLAPQPQQLSLDRQQHTPARNAALLELAHRDANGSGTLPVMAAAGRHNPLYGLPPAHNNGGMPNILWRLDQLASEAGEIKRRIFEAEQVPSKEATATVRRLNRRLLEIWAEVDAMERQYSQLIV